MVWAGGIYAGGLTSLSVIEGTSQLTSTMIVPPNVLSDIEEDQLGTYGLLQHTWNGTKTT